MALLGELARTVGARVFITITCLDDAVRRKLEPFAAPIDKRFEVLRRLSDAGVPTGVAIAPVIPGLTDSDILGILERAKEAGASDAFMVLLRLPAEVKDVFSERLREAFPLRFDKVMNGLTEMRGGKLYDARFGARMEGRGTRWTLIEQLFRTQCRRLGLNVRDDAVEPPSRLAQAPRRSRQLPLFE